MDPEHMRKSQFLKLLRDCLIVRRGSASREKADISLERQNERKQILKKLHEKHTKYGKKMRTSVQANVTYTSVVKRKNRKSNIEKMTYNDFLNALMKIAIEMYAGSKNVKSVDDAFQQLLIDNVLHRSLADRREPDLESIQKAIAEPRAAEVLRLYKGSTRQIFFFYATAQHQKSKRIRAAHQKDKHVEDSNFGADSLEKVKTRSARQERQRKLNPNKQALGYNEFLKFANDFNLSSSLLLSTMEVGEIYLSAIHTTKTHGYIRQLTHNEFEQALVHCAMKSYEKKMEAFRKADAQSPEIRMALEAYKNRRVNAGDKIRALFLHMWRAIHKTVPRAVESRRGVYTYDADLRRGSSKFISTFAQQWQEDEYRDYLAPDGSAIPDARLVLDRLLQPEEAGAPDSSSAPAAAMPGQQMDESPLTMTMPPPPGNESSAFSPSAKAMDVDDEAGVDPVSVERIRDYLDNRPDLKGLLQQHILDPDPYGAGTHFADEAGAPESDLAMNEYDFLEPEGDTGAVSLDEYERAMAALKSQIGHLGQDE